MGDASLIEWTDATWNPVTGCSKVSPGCAHCYAERLSLRFGWSQDAWLPSFAARNVVLHPDRLQLPLRWKQPRRVFVNSMSDLFHELVPIEFIQEVFSTMRQATWHQFQILTKRSQRLRELASQIEWPDNVWMGVTVENQRWTERIDDLRTVPSAIRFLSLEPLLGPLNLDLSGIDWVIVGGESGPGARPMCASWVLSIQDQCRDAGVPFFFKQWGAFDEWGRRRGKKAAGRELNGQTWDGIPRTRELTSVP